MGCGTTKYVPVIEFPQIKPCPKPSKPYELLKLDVDYLESKHGNAEKMMQNIIIRNAYIEDLQKSILCYEKQMQTINEMAKQSKAEE